MRILITGSSRGIGAAIARNFAKQEIADLFLVSRNMYALEKLKKDILKDHSSIKVHLFPTDLSDESNIREMVSEIKQITDRLDAIINNAGYLAKGNFHEIGLNEINRSLMINYIAPSLIIKECIGLLKNAHKPHIVNIASMGGFQGSVKYPGLSHYSASKAAIASLTECLATEFKGEIAVNCLAIGSVQTEMLQEAFPGYDAPLKADEMAEFICHFVINAHKYLNGKIIPVSLMNP